MTRRAAKEGHGGARLVALWVGALLISFDLSPGLSLPSQALLVARDDLLRLEMGGVDALEPLGSDWKLLTSLLAAPA